MNNDFSAEGQEILDIYRRFLRETLMVKAAELYLFQEEIAAREAEGDLKNQHNEFVELLQPHYDSPRSFFLERIFILLVAAFELYLQDTLAVVIRLNPKKIGDRSFRLLEILDSDDNDLLVRRGIEETLNQMMYKRPQEYLADLVKLLSIDGNSLREDWAVFVEAKARRDLGVHNGWRCNATYLKKVAEVGLTTAFTLGQLALPNEKGYLQKVSDTLSELAHKISQLVAEKHSASFVRTDEEKHQLNVANYGAVLDRN